MVKEHTNGLIAQCIRGAGNKIIGIARQIHVA